MTSLLRADGIALQGRLHPTDLAIAAGQLVALIGPNGGGKTSLLRTLADVERTEGEVVVDGERLTRSPPARRPYLATFLPASRDLPWPIAARDVIALGQPQADPDRVDELIALLELEGLAHRQVDRLSTGERARVLFARALATRPKVLLLDEPLSNLDPYWVLRFLEILRDVARGGSSVVIALHDIDRVSHFDRTLLIKDGQVVADLPPADMLESADFSRAFGIERSETGWAVIRTADQQSSL